MDELSEYVGKDRHSIFTSIAHICVHLSVSVPLHFYYLKNKNFVYQNVTCKHLVSTKYRQQENTKVKRIFICFFHMYITVYISYVCNLHHKYIKQT